MGSWGDEAWDNDTAADWFGDLLESTELRERWLEGIHDNRRESVRAALWLFAKLGRIYIWPVNHLESDADIAVRAGERLCNDEWLQEEAPGYVSKIKDDIEQIKSRMNL